MSIATEKTYYQRGNVLITSTRAEIAGKTFVMSNITSVSLAEIPPNTGCAVPFLFLGIGFSVLGFAGMVIDGGFSGSSNAVLILIGVLFAAGGIAWLRTLETEYAVNLSSASGETRVMQSTDRKHIEEIVQAIKQAVIDGGIQKVEAVSGSQTVMSSDDAVQKLKSLKEMLDSGVITAREYETKKAEILSRM